MKVKDIQIDGFGVWTGLSVDCVAEGMTLFYGPNEAGKTTLMQFMRAMLYGFTDDRREKYLPPLHGGTPGGAVRVTGPGGGYQICRHSQLTDVGATGRLSVTGQDGLSQGQHRLSMLLGQVDEAIFTNVFAIGMRELQELSTLDDTAAADELYKLSSGLDRVSLVDVLRGLRAGRGSLVGRSESEVEAERTKLAGLISRRQRLRDEVQQLTSGGRRWSELALQRRVQMQEIDQLRKQMSAWEREARVVEIATGVLETWTERDEVEQQIAEIETEVQLPDEAPGQLVQIEAMMDDRREKLEEIKRKRHAIRDSAGQLPVSRRILDLKGRIEAASEQVTWVEALEEQIERLDRQIESAHGQLDADATRLGLDDEERQALVAGDHSKVPDLSRETLSALAEPAKLVKQNTFLLKQARTETSEHKSRADKFGAQLKEVLQRARADNLQQAIRHENETLTKLRHRTQLGEHLEKLKRHYRDLEKETIDLTTSEALPVDRLLLLSVPFMLGGMSILYGIFHLFGVEWFVDPDPTWGMVCMVIGVMSLLVYYFGRENGQRSTSLDREDCERQIDTLRRQIREIETERNDVDSTLPTSNQSLDARLRESERLLAELEASLPTYHNHQAAIQAYKSAKDRAQAASDGVRDARRQWRDTLERLGLSDSLSPSSVRKLSDGYETLQASRRRLAELESEKDQRRRERQTIAKRIETLYLEALEVSQDEADKDDADHQSAPAPALAASKPKTGPLDQLNHLHEQLSRQQHWIKRRRELKEQDQQLRRQQAACSRSIERGEQQRRALWAKCGVATAQQFYELVDSKASLADLNDQYEELDKKVQALIGKNVQYDDVATEIEGASAEDLDRRWESLTGRVSETETRVAVLRTAQGELAQEMKQLADDKRLTVAQLELGCVERQIESVCRRWQTLATASCLLEDVCSTIERNRQPETLREASSFLHQLTDGKYTRIWTPLGTNQLKIDDGDGSSLALELLSRGTREAVFIALRLSLAAAYARRGVMLPLVLDDVLVNFDRDRAMHAAQTLKTFAELGHQVMMFTCHDHIVDIFHDIGVEVRVMPEQGQPGRAEIWEPEEEEYEEPEYQAVQEVPYEEETTEYQQALERPAEPEQVTQEPSEKPQPQPVAELKPEPKPAAELADPKPPVNPPPPLARPKPQPVAISQLQPEPIEEIGWAWFQREPGARLDEVEDALASITDGQQVDEASIIQEEPIPEEIWNRDHAWWSGNQASRN